MAEEKNPPKVSEMRTASDVFAHYAPESRSDEVPVWAQKRESERTALRTTVDTQQRLREAPRPVTPKAKERLDKRIIREIFGSRDCYDWYMKKLRAAIRSISPDDLYRFIHEHPSYGKSNFEGWNRDFAELVNIGEIPKKHRGANLSIRNRRIAAAAQRVLVDMYEDDVFQLTFDKPKTNPWIYVDGETGPYTVSVLNDYWVAKYGKSRPDLYPPAPGRSEPNERHYPPDSQSYASWLTALSYLEGHKKKIPELEPPPKDKPAHEDFGAIVLSKWAERDTAGKIETNKLAIKDKQFDLGMSLSDALGQVYGEEPRVKQAPRTFRVMHLLAQKVRAAVEQIKIRAGDTLSITPQGLFTITGKNRKNPRRSIQLPV